MLIEVKNVEGVAPKPVAARVGIGGPVGSGKTALIEAADPRCCSAAASISRS